MTNFFGTQKASKARIISKSNELILRKHFLLKAQRQHLAPELCSLNEIYVDQKLYSHPLHANIQALNEEEPLFFIEALSISDVPELACDFPLPKLTLPQALSGGSNIAIAGGIGTGKSTCMANFAIEILENRCTESNFHDYLPVFVHILQLIPHKQLPLIEILSRCVFDEGIDSAPYEIAKVLSDYHDRSRLLLLVDGLDELRKTEFDLSVQLLQRIHQENPKVLMVTTCGPYYSGRLDKAGFHILPIIPPGRIEQKSLRTAWLKVWSKIRSSSESVNMDDVELTFGDLWLNQEYSRPTFSDLTFSILATHFRDYVPHNRPVIPYLKRMTENKVDIDTFIHLSVALGSTGFSALSSQELSRKFSELTGANSLKAIESVNLLQKSGVLAQYGDLLRFTNPTILCQLMSLETKKQPNAALKSLLYSPVDNLTILNSTFDHNYLINCVNSLDPFDVRSISLILNHLFNTIGNPSNFSSTYPKLVKYLVAQEVPLSTKIKIATMIYYTNPKIFSQLLSKLNALPGKDNLKICSFFYGFYPLDKFEEFVIKSTERHQDSIALFGFYSLLNSSDPRAQQLLMASFHQNPEKYGRLISELCSQHPDTGHGILRSIAQEEDADLRRFSLYGLRLIEDDWANELLDDISRNDKAWIIRDTASQALHNKYKPQTYAPQKLPPVFENPVILNAASRHCVGIPTNTDPFNSVLEILENGTSNEVVQVIQYILANPTEAGLQRLKNIIAFDNPAREIACQALYEISLRS